LADPIPRDVGEQRDRHSAQDRTELVVGRVGRRDDARQFGAARLDDRCIGRAERDQLRHVLRDPAQHGADQEDDDRDLQHQLAPVQIPELPVSGVTIVDASRYAVTTQDRCSTPPSSPTIVGNAVATIV
jgi:hypothetical protein